MINNCRYKNADKNDLNNWMFLNEPEKIMSYIDYNFMEYAYDDILKFISKLAVGVVIEGIDDVTPSVWLKDTKKCYYKLKEHYLYEKKLNERKLKFKKEQNTVRSSLQLG